MPVRQAPLRKQRDLLRFMPFYTVATIGEIEYGLLKYRNLQPDRNMPSKKFFQYNNLLNKDNLDNKLDPYPVHLQQVVAGRK